MRLEVLAVEGMPEVRAGDDLAALIAAALERQGDALRDGDVVVVAQKAVSKAEGRVRDLASVTAGDAARDISARVGADARLVQAVLDESCRVVRDTRVLIVETHHGFVCANAGVDRSNVPGADCITLLPVDADASAERLCRGLRERTGAAAGVVVSDTFGRPWRVGQVNVALGVAGAPALLDHRGRADDCGVTLRSTVIAVADEMASAAELVMGKTERVPAAVVRGWRATAPPGTGRDLLRAAEFDLFR